MQTLAHSVFLKALGWSLINSLWQMGVLWLIYFLTTINTNKLIAGIRHTFATVLLSSGVIWFIFTFIYYCNNFQSGNIVALFLFSEVNILLSFVSKVFYIVNLLLPFFACIYIFVLGYQLLQYSRYFFQSTKLVHEGLHKMNPQFRMFAAEIALRLGIKKKVELFLSDHADSPMTIGFMKYIILIPLATINNLSTIQVEAILLHELAHIKRNDYLLNLMVTAVEMIFFFNPFCRLFVSAIKKERENSCDDLVLQFKYDPHVYVMALLSLEKSRHIDQPLVIAASGKNNKLLLQRVKRITGQAAPRSPIRAKFIIFFLLSVLAGLLLQSQFKIIPPVFPGAVVQVQDKKKTAETFHVVYRSNPAFAKTVPIKISKIIVDQPKIVPDNDEVISLNDDNLVDLNAVQQQSDDDAQEDNVRSADQSEVVNFSIPETKTNDAPRDASSEADYPYVAKSSFRYDIVLDSATHGRGALANSDMSSRQALEQNLQMLEEFDWQKIQRAITINQKSISTNLKKLTSLTRKTLTGEDLKKISQEFGTSITNADESRIKSDIKIQLEALQDLQSKNLTEAKKLEADILKNQIKLQLSYYQKRQEVLRKINTAKRKLKIVEI
jgi:beta-lactamase regulating signal transducer with metallopeptidase domain